MKTNLKRNLLQTCLLAVVVLALPAAVEAQFTYITNADNTITITGYTGSGGDVAIPATINGLPVTDIGDEAFYGTVLTNVTIPDSVTNIGDDAFADCYGLINLTIPDSVINVGGGTFDYCYNLANVIIGNGVVNIGDHAFYGTRLTSVIIPNSVTNIGDWAFADVGLNFGGDIFDGLTNVTIGDHVTRIGNYAFYQATSLTDLTIPDSVTCIGDHAFDGCSSDTGYPGGLTDVVIGNGVATIGNYAFFNCPYLNRVVIGSGVTNIGDYAFAVNDLHYYGGYSRLTEVFFGGSVPSSMGLNAFSSYIVWEWGQGYYPDFFATIYYLPNTTGWSDTFAGLPTALWLPQVQTGDGNFGVKNNQFGFNISWASGQTVVVETSTNLSDWTPIATKTLTDDTSYFSDSEWTNYPSRFYKLVDFFTPPPGSGGITGFDFYLDICRSPNSDFYSRIEAFHMIVTFVISNEIRDPILLSWASEAASIVFFLEPDDPDLNIFGAYYGGVRGP